MRNALLTIAAVLALAAPARADTITVTITTQAALCSAGCTKTFSDVSSGQPNTLGTKIVSTFQSACNQSINGTCTALQVANFWVTSVRNSLVANVSAADQTALQTTAVAGYAPINPQ
jgi:hypothetical protein